MLEEALIAFPGVVLVVSHDRYFLNRVCTDILAFEGDERIAHSVGDYDYYLEKRARQATLAPSVRKAESRVATKAGQRRLSQTNGHQTAQAYMEGNQRTRRHGGPHP